MKTTAAIQAGGSSRRMGRDKALLPFLGATLIERVIARVAPLVAEVILIANDVETYRRFGLPVYPDQPQGAGPLRGLSSALAHAAYPLVLNVACDMPFLNFRLLQYEIELCAQPGVDVVIPCSPAGMEPLHAVLRRDACRAPVQQALEKGERRLISWLAQVSVRIIETADVEKFDPNLLSFFNINTPEDLLMAEKLASREQPLG
jgi:molybdopterin-guanine dinucleotide biosynthesis protein A